MKKINFVDISNSVKSFTNKNGSKICLGLGIVGGITAAIMAVRVTPKATDIIKEEESLKKIELDDETYELHTAEKVKLTWKLYLPSVGLGVTSVALLLYASKIDSAKLATVSSAYSLSEKAFKEYKKAVKETVGEKKEKEVNDKLSENQLAENPLSRSKVLITGNGETLCFDPLSGRYFKSDIEKIKKAENELNLVLRNEDYSSLNSFYDMLNIEPIKLGSNLGWNINSDGYIDVKLSAQISDEHGIPCIVINYSEMPHTNFDYYG